MFYITSIIILALSVGHACLYGYSHYVRRREGQSISFREICGIALYSVQAAFGTIIIYILFIMRPVVNILQRRSLSKAPRRDPHRYPPLLFVHPALCNAGSWLMYLWYFLKAGYSRFHFFEYSCRESSLQLAGKRLANEIDRLIETYQGEKPIIIGASLGALIARAALAQMKKADCVKGFITLACPHSGTYTASAVPASLFPLLHNITYRGEGITALEKNEIHGSNAHFPRIAFASDRDEMVVPSSSLHPPQCTNQNWKIFSIHSISHMNIMLHIPTIRKVLYEVVRLSAE